jgi:hypothetical protein
VRGLTDQVSVMGAAAGRVLGPGSGCGCVDAVMTVAGTEPRPAAHDRDRDRPLVPQTPLRGGGGVL